MAPFCTCLSVVILLMYPMVCQGNGNQGACRQIKYACGEDGPVVGGTCLQGSRGKVGEKGSKGEPGQDGLPGPPGAPAERADFARASSELEAKFTKEINALIVGDNETKETIKNVNQSLAGHKEKTELEINTLMIKDNDTMAMIEKLNESVAILKEENTKKDQVIDALIIKDNETMAMMQMLNESNKFLERENERKEQQISELKSSLEKLNATVQVAKEFCKVYYGGKCFWYVEETRTYSEAEAICARVHGGRPAVVYSVIHYEQLMTYIRSVIDYRTYFWLGLKINPSTKEVTIISEETPAPFLKWHPSYPSSGSGYTSVTVQVYKDPSNSNNGMYNKSPTSTTMGVLCEA